MKKINSTTFKQEIKTDWRDRLEVVVGDDKQVDFKEQVKLQRWDNEVNLSCRLIDDEKKQVKKSKGKLVAKGQKKESHFYEISPNEQLPEGGFEFEVFLNEKPDTNVLEFSLNTKGLRFYYQPGLTQKQIEEGARRPEHIVGSYAVYHESKGGVERADGKSYKCGKVGHIHRPLIKDANGNTVWGSLKIENNVLSVEVSQEFLNTAVYPVSVDPTFGYESQGASHHALTDYINGVSGLSPGDDGTVDSISAYLEDLSSYNEQYAIYDDSDNSLINTTNVSSGGSDTTHWITLSFSSSPLILVSGTYVLAARGDGVTMSSDQWIRYDDVSSSGGAFDSLDWGNSWPDPWNYPSGNENYKMSIYATYTTSSSTVTKTHTTDTLLQKTETKTHSTDSLLQATKTKTHTTDILLQAIQTKNHTTDTFLKAVQEKTHTTDSYLAKWIYTTWQNTLTTGDTYNESISGLTANTTYEFQTQARNSAGEGAWSASDTFDTKTPTDHTTDTLLLKTQTKTHTSDSLLSAKREKTHDTDSLLNAVFTQTHTTNTLLEKVQTDTHTTDSLLQAIQTQTYTTDSLLNVVQKKTHTTDTLLQKVQTKVHTTDSFLNTISQATQTHTTDSLLQATTTQDFTTDSLLSLVSTLDFTTDTFLNKQKTVTHSTDSILKGAQTQTHTTDSILGSGAIKQFTTDTLLRKEKTVTSDVDSLLNAVRTATLTTDTLLQGAQTQTHTTDGYLSQRYDITFTTDTLLAGTQTVSSDTDAYLVSRFTETHTTDMSLAGSGTQTHTTDTYLASSWDTENTPSTAWNTESTPSTTWNTESEPSTTWHTEDKPRHPL